jgi:RND family efflux transporter MFP subunit
MRALLRVAMPLLMGIFGGALVLLFAGPAGSPGGRTALAGGSSGAFGSPPADVLEVPGKTRATFGRRAQIAPVPLHPVTEVKVKPGDRVRKGQLLVQLDDDEPQADVRARRASLEAARVTLKESRRALAAADRLYSGGVLPEITYFNLRTSTLKAEQDERVARAALDSSLAELEHYTVNAAIDGVVAWLDVYPGTVSRPGTTLWGEIIDLREIDVRCELTPDQADRVAVGRQAEVLANGSGARLGVGRVTFVGVAADPNSGLVPVLVHFDNLGERLRCDVPVKVRFHEASDALSPPAR